MNLPIFKDDNQPFQLMQSKWASIINPVLSNELLDGNLIKNISLINGEVTFNHKLARDLVGWLLIDISAQARIYRSKPINDKTISITSDAAATASFWVF